VNANLIYMAKLLSPLCLLILFFGESVTAAASRYAYSIDTTYSSVLTVIDTANPAVVARIPLGPSNGALAADPAGYFVYAAQANSIAVVDANSRTIAATIPVANPIKLVLNPSGKTLYALTSTYPGQPAVFVIDTRSHTVTAKIDLPQNSTPRYIAVLPAGNKIYVSYTNPDSVIAIDGSTNKVTSTIQGLRGQLAVNPDGNSVYVLDSASLSFIDTRTDTVTATLAIPASANSRTVAQTFDIAVDAPGAWIYLGVADSCGTCFNGNNGRVLVIDAAQRSIVSTIPLPIIPWALTITPSGTRIYAIGSIPGSGCISYCPAGGVAVVDTANRSLLTTIPPPGTNPGFTTNITVQPDGALVYAGYFSHCCGGDGVPVSSGMIGTDIIDTGTNTKIEMLPSSGRIIFKPDANPPAGGPNRFYTMQSRSGTAIFPQWGLPGDIPVPADYDGDGKADIAVFRPREGVDEAIWYIIRSSDGAVIRQPWGSVSLGDVPVPADYFGEGRADLAVWRPPNYFHPSDAGWYIQRSSDGQLVHVTFASATGTDAPVTGDFDGDGHTDAAIYYQDQTQGTWLIDGSSTGLSKRQFGNPGDVPVPADYDGDGRVDLAVWTPTTGVWSVLKSSDGTVMTVGWGAPGDIPIPRDFDGDRKADFAIWRPSTGVWWIINSKDGSITITGWGAPGDIPISADYDGDGRADLSVYRP
jgi:YVTN family beta-propeller protein